MKTLALVAKPDNAPAQEIARELARRHPDRRIVAEPHLAEALGWTVVPEDTLMAEADLVIVLGGDGTLIRAARLLKGRGVPLLGVNLGSLGFMTEIPRSDVYAVVEQTLKGEARFDSRMKLTCRLLRGGKLLVEEDALNDVVLNKGALARISDFEMSVDGEHVTTYKADGVIIATPTGSTAYSLSAGGPIVHPSIEGMLVTPICSHALTQRPILAPPERTIRLVLHGENADVYLTLDGQSGHTLASGDTVEILRSPHRVQLVRNPERSYFSILREKLHWGER